MSTNNEQSNIAIAAVEEAMIKVAQSKSVKAEVPAKVAPNKTSKRSASQP